MTISEVLNNQKSYHFETGDTLEVLKGMPDSCVDVVVTSPAYWGLREYGTGEWVGGDPECPHKVGRFERGGLSSKQASNRGSGGDEARLDCLICGAVKIDSQLGLERNPDCRGYLTGNPCGECYVCRLVEIFREIRRVLRPEGCVWLNIGDTYATHQAGGKDHPHNGHSAELADQIGHTLNRPFGAQIGLKEKDLIGIPWRVAFALQADGWWLRSDTIWAKISVMPFSGSGWQWEQHMIKNEEDKTPCPGCEKCSSNDGLVLTKGSWRPTNSHEYIFQLAKSPQYFTDPLAVRQLPSEASLKRIRQPGFELQTGEGKGDAHEFDGRTDRNSRRALENFARNPGRSLWDVWVVPAQPLKAEHFAAFPPGIPELAIRASISKGGYCEFCHAPYARIVEKERFSAEDMGNAGQNGAKWLAEEEQSSVKRLGKNREALRTSRREMRKWEKAREADATSRLHQNAYAQGYDVHDNPFPIQHTRGWKPTCTCGSKDPVSAVVLDPFSGSGTTLRVAYALGVRGIGIDLNAKYNKLAEELIGSAKLIQKESYGQIPDSQLSLFD